MYKEDLALNNLQWLICHKTQPNQLRNDFYGCCFFSEIKKKMPLTKELFDLKM